MRIKARILREAAYWGAIWGTLELTAGTLMHLLPYNAGWLLWLPLATGCMMGVYRATGKLYAMVLSACAAAAIKLTLLLTPARTDLVVNPAICILLESLALSFALAYTRGVPAKILKRAVFALGVNVAWRGMYALYLAISPEWIYEISVLSSRGAIMKFFVVENIVTTVILFALLSVPAIRSTQAKPHAPVV